MSVHHISPELARDDETGFYFDPSARDLDRDFYWTAFCGEGGEEIDVVARSEARARVLVRLAIEADYEPIELKTIERRYRGIMYL